MNNSKALGGDRFAEFLREYRGARSHKLRTRVIDVFFNPAAITSDANRGGEGAIDELQGAYPAASVAQRYQALSLHGHFRS